MVITLIGYRGTGKSTLAAPLAQRLGWEWLDADVELERRAGRSIKSIFDTDGEPEFRRLERELLAELLKRDRLVLAAGGGAIGNEATRADLKAAGPVIWLRASVETIERRLATDPTTGQRRPNLTSSGGRAEIERLLTLREPLYRECATIIIEADQSSPEQLVESVLHQFANLSTIKPSTFGLAGGVSPPVDSLGNFGTTGGLTSPASHDRVTSGGCS